MKYITIRTEPSIFLRLSALCPNYYYFRLLVIITPVYLYHVDGISNITGVTCVPVQVLQIGSKFNYY